MSSTLHGRWKYSSTSPGFGRALACRTHFRQMKRPPTLRFVIHCPHVHLLLYSSGLRACFGLLIPLPETKSSPYAASTLSSITRTVDCSTHRGPRVLWPAAPKAGKGKRHPYASSVLTSKLHGRLLLYSLSSECAVACQSHFMQREAPPPRNRTVIHYPYGRGK